MLYLGPDAIKTFIDDFAVQCNPLRCPTSWITNGSGEPSKLTTVSGMSLRSGSTYNGMCWMSCSLHPTERDQGKQVADMEGRGGRIEPEVDTGVWRLQGLIELGRLPVAGQKGLFDRRWYKYPMV